MVIVVTVVISAGVIGVLISVAVLLKRLFAGGSGLGAIHQTSPPPYGALPGLGAVGSLGELSPDADINDPSPTPGDLFGH